MKNNLLIHVPHSSLYIPEDYRRTALISQAELEEERRLAYVGMTRAMRRLFLTYAGSRMSYGSRNFAMPSRFLTELGYNPYGSAGYGGFADGSSGGFRDEDGDGFMDYNDGFDDFSEEDFDPFPDDVPIFE